MSHLLACDTRTAEGESYSSISVHFFDEATDHSQATESHQALHRQTSSHARNRTSGKLLHTQPLSRRQANADLLPYPHVKTAMGMAKRVGGKPQSHQWLFGSENLTRNASARDLHTQCSCSPRMSMQRLKPHMANSTLHRCEKQAGSRIYQTTARAPHFTIQTSEPAEVCTSLGSHAAI